MKRKIIECRILKTYSIEALQQSINNMLDEEWEIQGTLIIEAQSHTSYYYQMMVRHEEIIDKKEMI